MMAGGPAPSHLLVISLVLSQDLFSHFLFPLVDIRVELVSVLLDGEFLIIVDGNEDLLGAYGLLLWIVELGHVWVLQGLLGRQALVWVKLEQILEKVERLFGCGWEHISQLLWLRWR